jgi:hypothetical protein
VLGVMYPELRSAGRPAKSKERRPMWITKEVSKKPVETVPSCEAVQVAPGFGHDVR